MDLGNLLFGKNGTQRAEEANKNLQEAYLAKELSKGTDSYGSYKNYYDDLTKQAKNSRVANANNKFGDGLVGSILNPMVQTGSAGLDLLTSGTSKWENGDRDLTSDIGAGFETGLTLATLGTGTAAKSLGKSLAKGALTGAGYGAFGTMNELGNNTWTPEGLGNLALSAGIGAGIGGGISGLGYGVNKLATGARNTRNMANAYQNYMNQAGGQTTNLLGDGVGGASIKSNPNIDWLNSRGKLARTKLGQAAQGIGDITSLAKVNGVSPLAGLTNSKLGKATSRVLSTTPGKIGAGVGTGLVLNKIFNGGNNAQDLSDEELDELYNYYYGGQ